MKIANTVTYTIPAGPNDAGPRYETSTTLVRPMALTHRGAERILRQQHGATGKRRARGPIVVRIETAIVDA